MTGKVTNRTEGMKPPEEGYYSGVIGTTVTCKIDRPLGSAHPKHPDIIYPVNYGFVPEVFAGDGAEQDVYILGVDKPLEEFTGKVLEVYHRLNDVEDKWIVVPEGVSFGREEILQKIEFQEKFFEGELYMAEKLCEYLNIL